VKGQCVVAGEHSEAYLCRLRKHVYEIMRCKKPHGFKLVSGCGNPRCIAFSHIRLQPWATFGRKHWKGDK
jgi:hypothetical protein